MSPKNNIQNDRKIKPTEKQSAQLATLQKNFDLSAEDIGRCLFFSQDQERPWIPSDLLVSIARRTGQFSSIDTEFSSYVRGLEQLIYKATVIDQDGRSVTRTGVATIGETPNGENFDEHKLAEGRALSQALNDQGFNPFRSHFVGGIVMAVARIDRKSEPDLASEKHQAELRFIADESERRRKDLAQIKLLAREKGLVVTMGSNGRETDEPYRDWLSTNFQTRTAVTLSPEERAQVINALRNYRDEDYLLNIPVELHEDAMIA